MWNLRTTVPVIVGALGMIRKGLDKNIKMIPGNIIQIIQKIALIGGAHILREVLTIPS